MTGSDSGLYCMRYANTQQCRERLFAGSFVQLCRPPAQHLNLNVSAASRPATGKLDLCPLRVPEGYGLANRRLFTCTPALENSRKSTTKSFSLDIPPPPPHHPAPRPPLALPGCGGRILRSSKEAFRERHDGNVREAAAASGGGVSSRVASTKQGRPADVEGEVVLESEPKRRSSGNTASSSSSTGGGKAAGALGLKEFMHRTRVLELYRGILQVGLPGPCPENFSSFWRSLSLRERHGE